MEGLKSRCGILGIRQVILESQLQKEPKNHICTRLSVMLETGDVAQTSLRYCNSVLGAAGRRESIRPSNMSTKERLGCPILHLEIEGSLNSSEKIELTYWSLSESFCG